MGKDMVENGNGKKDKAPKRGLYLTDGKVAWQIPPGRISRLYRDKAYLTPPGWFVVPFKEVKNWNSGSCGILRLAIS